MLKRGEKQPMTKHELLLRGFGRSLPISQRCWAEIIFLAKMNGWISPEPKTSLLLVGRLVGEDDAEKLADALQAVDKYDAKEYLAEVIEFCRAGAFMVEPLGVKND